MRVTATVAVLVQTLSLADATRRRRRSTPTRDQTPAVVSVDRAEMVAIALATDTIGRLDGAPVPRLRTTAGAPDSAPEEGRSPPSAKKMKKLRQRWTREILADAAAALEAHAGGAHGVAFARHCVSPERWAAVDAALGGVGAAALEAFGGCAALSGRFVLAGRHLRALERSQVFTALRELDVGFVVSGEAVAALIRLAETAEAEGRAEVLALAFSGTCADATAAFYGRVLSHDICAGRPIARALPVSPEVFSSLCARVRPGDAARALVAAVGGDDAPSFAPYVEAARLTGRYDAYVYMLTDRRAPGAGDVPLPGGEADRTRIADAIAGMRFAELSAAQVLRLAALLVRLGRREAAAGAVARFMASDSTHPADYARALSGCFDLGLLSALADPGARGQYDADDYLFWVCIAAHAAGLRQDDAALARLADAVVGRTGASWDAVLRRHPESLALVLGVMPLGTRLSLVSRDAVVAALRAERSAHRKTI